MAETAPSQMSLPLALFYARQGYAIRRWAWGETGTGEAKALIFSRGSNLYFHKNADHCRVVWQPTDLTEEDHRAHDWTLLPPGCAGGEPCTCAGEGDPGWPFYDDESFCSLYPLDNPNAAMGLVGCNLPAPDGTLIPCEDCADDPATASGGGSTGGSGGSGSGGGSGTGSGGGALRGLPGFGDGSGGGSPRKRSQPRHVEHCPPISFDSLAIDDASCIPDAETPEERTWTGNVIVGQPADGQNRLYWLTVRFAGEIIKKQIVAPGDTVAIDTGAVARVAGAQARLHAEIYLPIIGCRKEVAEWLSWPDLCPVGSGSGS